MIDGKFARGVLPALIFTLAIHGFTCAVSAADSLDGWWQSDGYGLLLEIKGEQVNAFETTAISCLPTATAKRQVETSDGAEAVLVMNEAPIKILVTAGTSADHRFFGFIGAASSIGFRRLAQPPATYGKQVANDPLTNFDIFWTTFDEHYPFFALKEANWRRVRDQLRPKVTDATTREELFDIFKSMVEPLGDAHTFIAAGSQKLRFGGRRKDATHVDAAARKRIQEIIETNYLHAKPKSWCNGRVGYGVIADSIGYLRITAFGGYTLNPDFDSQIKALEASLDDLFNQADNLTGLVVDVRINGGGSDLLGVTVANRLATNEYLAFRKKARSDAADPTRFTEQQDTRVRPSDRPHFHGKVVLLTSGETISAGETFSMALMGRTPAVVRVGQHTQGVFSDVLDRKLPNGFRFGLPNEIFLTEGNEAFDGPGIPPHVSVEVFSANDLEAGRDTALEKALELMRQE